MKRRMSFSSARESPSRAASENRVTATSSTPTESPISLSPASPPETALDEMVGKGGNRGGQSVQRHDSPHHIAIGDSVTGEGITVLGVEFSPGFCAALVDYVGPLVEFRKRCELEQAGEEGDQVGSAAARVTTMHKMLADGNEDTLAWNRVTNGLYSELSKKNEDHFGPDKDGEEANHSSTFIDWTVMSLKEGAKGNLEEGRAHLYTAEHFLQDAFSSGHLAAQPDITEAVNALISSGEVAAWMPLVASSVYDLGSETIRCYGIEQAGVIVRLNRAAFIAMVGYVFGWENDGNSLVYAAMRKFVHERLDAGVKVSSPAHPEPWMMYGDHRLNNDEQETTVTLLQNALADLRDLFDANATSPVGDPKGQAASLLAHHKPTPTSEGQDVIAEAIRMGTANRLLFMAAMAESGYETLAGALDTAAYEQDFIIRIENPNELREGPDLPELDRGERDPGERFVPKDRPKYPDSGNRDLPSYFDSPGLDGGQDEGESSLGPVTDDGASVQLAETATEQASEKQAPITEAIAGAIDSLHDAFANGVEELDRAARSIPLPDLSGALEQLPEVAEKLLSVWWPDHTGWAAVVSGTGNASADLLLMAGVPAEIELDADVSCQVSVARTAGAVTVSFKPSFVGNEGGAATVKALKIPGGVMFKAAGGISLTVDLARVQWPANALALLSSGDFRGALAEILGSAISLARNTQVAVDGGITVDNELGFSAGDDDLFEALIANGLGIGLKLSGKNPTETAPGSLQFEGNAAAFLDLEIAATEGLPKDAPIILRLAQTLVEMSGTGRAAPGMRLAITMPPLGTGGSLGIEVGVTSAVSGDATLIGQSGGAEGKGEIVLGLGDIVGFVETLASGEALDAASMVAASSGINATLSGSCTLNQIGVLELLATWFPSLVDVKLPNSLKAKLSAEFKVTGADIAALISRAGSAWADFFSTLWEGDLTAALERHADLALEHMAEVVGMLKSVTIHIEGQIISKEGGQEFEEFAAEAGLGASATLWAVFDRKFGPEEFGATALQEWLRGIIEDGESAQEAA